MMTPKKDSMSKMSGRGGAMISANSNHGTKLLCCCRGADKLVAAEFEASEVRHACLSFYARRNVDIP